jgi:hypothetical protein
MSTSEAQKESSMRVEPQKEHRWLQKLVGEWTYKSEASMGPDAPPESCDGTESVRTVGGVWILAEGQGEMPGGGPMTTLLTLAAMTRRKSGSSVRLSDR